MLPQTGSTSPESIIRSGAVLSAGPWRVAGISGQRGTVKGWVGKSGRW